MSAKKIGRPKNPPKPKKVLKELLPVEDIFEPDEQELYNSLVDIYMDDFDSDDLTSVDVDDIMVLAINKVLEVRLLKSSKGNAAKHLDISASIEKLRKQTEKIKENLSARRKDRIDPKDYKGISIVDLAIAFDKEKRDKLERKVRKLKKEKDESAKELKSHTGNRYDVDGTDIKSTGS